MRTALGVSAARNASSIPLGTAGETATAGPASATGGFTTTRGLRKRKFEDMPSYTAEEFVSHLASIMSIFACKLYTTGIHLVGFSYVGFAAES